MTVGDFRPKSCCNVLYKIIAKLIVQRLSMLLDKLTSPCQAAFVPGWSIRDNIMLAQKLFMGYNQARLSPQCALKVDIRKAYDTVEWDFMTAAMRLFGFPPTFIMWIEAYTTTPSFSIGINGKPHGFFQGARGLRQAKIFQLGFADDILLFCHADMDSIGIFKTGLDCFEDWSGLRLNGSHLIISRATQGLREEMLTMLGFQGVLQMSWRKVLRLWAFIRPLVDYQIGDGGTSTYGRICGTILALITTLPRALRRFGIEEATKLCRVISGGEWQWPPIIDLEFLEITNALPTIHGGEDLIVWKTNNAQPTAHDLYMLFDPPGLKVGWSSLLSGSLKIPRHSFILWLAILGRLARTEKPWLSHLGPRILCTEESAETHNHLFFECRFSRQCLKVIRRQVRFQWPNKEWNTNINWAAQRKRGKHIVNMSYRPFLATRVYHIWKKRNIRLFEHTERTPIAMAVLIVEHTRQRIHSSPFPESISTRALLRLWRIPWPVVGETNR
ncbi:UNVERIFIED_CONTAM: hypothetical protein Sindi_0057500 [Sesamum indicum]